MAKYAKVHIYENLADSKIEYTVHYYGKTLHTGSVYNGNAFNAQSTRRVKNHAKDKAEKWAIENGFDGIELA